MKCLVQVGFVVFLLAACKSSKPSESEVATQNQKSPVLELTKPLIDNVNRLIGETEVDYNLNRRTLLDTPKHHGLSLEQLGKLVEYYDRSSLRRAKEFGQVFRMLVRATSVPNNIQQHFEDIIPDEPGILAADLGCRADKKGCTISLSSQDFELGDDGRYTKKRTRILSFYLEKLVDNKIVTNSAGFFDASDMDSAGSLAEKTKRREDGTDSKIPRHVFGESQNFQ